MSTGCAIWGYNGLLAKRVYSGRSFNQLWADDMTALTWQRDHLGFQHFDTKGLTCILCIDISVYVETEMSARLRFL